MIQLRIRHFLHPVRSAKGLYGLGRKDFSKLRARQELSRLQRGRRDACWCGGRLDPFQARPSYGVCRACGGYVNQQPPLLEELRRLYSFRFYWHRLQDLKGHPEIESRSAVDRSDGRLDFWLSLVESAVLPGKRVVEIGCAHGVLLQELSDRGFSCVGVEVDSETASWTQKITGLPILAGMFPGVRVPECDLFLAFDVLEHSVSPEDFLLEAARLLPLGGMAIIQSPIEFRSLDPPFGAMYERTFDDAQHLFIFSRRGIELLAERTGFSVVAEHDWRVGHEIVVLRKEMQMPGPLRCGISG